MSDTPDTPPTAAQPPAAAEGPVAAPLEPGVPPTDPSPAWAPSGSEGGGGPAAVVADRPEIAVGAAFAGGLALALILKRLAR